jgi:two-component system chemotaxis response regulator CheY
MAMNVLVVDDSAVMRKMIVRTLRLSGLPLGDLYEAGNGQEGLDALRDHWVDLALVDINMPLMNGEEMVDRVRQNPETADLSVILVSTDCSETRIEMLQKKGAGFAHKPFTPEGLREAISHLTGVAHDEQTGEGISSGRGPDF